MPHLDGRRPQPFAGGEVQEAIEQVARVLRPGVDAAEHPQVLALLAVGDEPGDAATDEHLVAAGECQVAGRVAQNFGHHVAGYQRFDILRAGLTDDVPVRVAEVADRLQHGLFGVVARLEREADRFEDVAEDAAVHGEVDRHGQHRPLEAADDIRPHGHAGAGHKVGVAEVVDVVVPGVDRPAAVLDERDGPGQVAHEVDDPERRQGPPPVDGTGVADRQRAAERKHGEVFAADDPVGAF